MQAYIYLLQARRTGWFVQACNNKLVNEKTIKFIIENIIVSHQLSLEQFIFEFLTKLSHKRNI